MVARDNRSKLAARIGYPLTRQAMWALLLLTFPAMIFNPAATAQQHAGDH